MKVHLVLEMELGINPCQAAKIMSKCPRVLTVMSIVDNEPMEIWRLGELVASEHAHPLVQRQLRIWEKQQKAASEPIND